MNPMIFRKDAPDAREGVYYDYSLEPVVKHTWETARDPSHREQENPSDVSTTETTIIPGQSPRIVVCHSIASISGMQPLYAGLTHPETIYQRGMTMHDYATAVHARLSEQSVEILPPPLWSLRAGYSYSKRFSRLRYSLDSSEPIAVWTGIRDQDWNLDDGTSANPSSSSCMPPWNLDICTSAALDYCQTHLEGAIGITTGEQHLDNEVRVQAEAQAQARQGDRDRDILSELRDEWCVRRYSSDKCRMDRDRHVKSVIFRASLWALDYMIRSKFATLTTEQLETYKAFSMDDIDEAFGTQLFKEYTEMSLRAWENERRSDLKLIRSSRTTRG
ncbi:uncharacterized protein I303_105541 [Kwoniella dejecticola CBS 10117]|uniref:Uncharacterized protein n=1 Tax=Kwoniella dejecticola CBS 10117 TaxID=1296121 RepID=A0A1A6A291_9TREE|nr:uncharacterized protein I303_05016 [Kwoniella dejecticola CBS 10117]OBR84159.1 hypothetical protein I303_05016 [Kwoniella dejecticola CBS 10117]